MIEVPMEKSLRFSRTEFGRRTGYTPSALVG